MTFNQIKLYPVNSRGEPVLLSEFSVLTVNRSTQSVVLRVPRGGEKIGSPITLITNKDETYKGFIEVVSEASDDWIYWCGVCFDPVSKQTIVGAEGDVMS